ncbi:Serine/threonine-protein kinase PrkC [Posidoniimonas corsicana]|uniref:Serine/threonine-protein kinase PrkC n=1 Tax=Posidoniimonas corsicana TaxID=1938618 RepID=A0A5C5VI23_9BACT|nr:protein kinase [Posidoniimonas corsicana]TWT37663.1 Serine/threonine-protein kinase PrkC [Posidoniimonas corsicana]
MSQPTPPPADRGADAPSDATREKLAQILDEYLESMENGEWPTLEELTRRHPDLAEHLPGYLEGLHLLQSSLGDSPLNGLRCDGNLLDDETVHYEAAVGVDKPTVNKRVGDFELINVIGRGGMGVVYEAWQLSLNRRVALKVLPFAAMLDERQTARFTTEAQAAAGLHHQNIVPVYAVGQQRGIHFYAMQFIDGHSLAEAIAEMRSERDGAASATDEATPRAASRIDSRSDRPPSSLGAIRGAAFFQAVARLGAEAADALDYAHRYGVVHRDVKPGNLLVDRDRKAWVTDFGLARVQSEMSMTMPGDLVGSLRYMSPEQARGRGDMIDCRTDVYGLGATLYELLTLQPAHSGEDHEELLHRVFNDDPTRPRKLNPAIPADLENIVLRAMEKRRDDRYATAEELADDLRRFLDGKPTAARRPSLADRTAKWVARRRGVAISAAAALVVVSVVSVASAIWIASAGRQTAEALRQSQASQALAEKHFEQARAVVDHFGGDLADRLSDIPGAETLRRELLSDTLGYYQRFLQSTPDDQSVASDMAATYFKSGAIAERLGETITARDFYAKAVEHWRQSPVETEQSDGAPLACLELGLGLGALARVQGQLGVVDDSEQLFGEAITILRECAIESPGDADTANALAETLSNFGLLLRRDGRSGLAASNIRESIKWLEDASRSAPEEPRYVRNIAVAKSNLSEALREHSPVEAITASRDARLAMRRLVQEYPEDTGFKADLAMTYNNLAAMQGAQGNWAAAAEGYRDAAGQIEQLVRRNPLIPRHRRELAITHSNLGLALARIGEPHESQKAFRVAEGYLIGLIGDFPQQTSYRSAMAALWNNRGVALQFAGQDEAALEAFEKAVDVQEELAEQGGISLAQASVLNRQYQNFAELLRRANRAEEGQDIERRRKELNQILDSGNIK